MTPDTDPTVRITTDTLRDLSACSEGIEIFEALYPDGLDYDPTDPVQCAELCAGPLAPHLPWAVRAGLPPMQVQVDDLGHATVAGYPH